MLSHPSLDLQVEQVNNIEHTIIFLVRFEFELELTLGEENAINK
jgi:hypothetical protein